jgi:hypothetical protein
VASGEAVAELNELAAANSNFAVAVVRFIRNCCLVESLGLYKRTQETETAQRQSSQRG